MIRRILSIAFALSLTSVLAHAAQSAAPVDAAVTPASTSAQPPAAAQAAASKPVHQDAGDRVFQANCGRCHSSPEGFSPRITGTIVMHMRVRANLSAKDQQLLMKYFAP